MVASFPLVSDMAAANAANQKREQVSGRAINENGYRSVMYPMMGLRRSCSNCGVEFVNPYGAAALGNGTCSPCHRVLDFYNTYDDYDEYDFDEDSEYHNSMLDDDYLDWVVSMSPDEEE